MPNDTPNIVAAELAEDVRAAARSLAASYGAARKHRLGWRALGPLRMGVHNGRPEARPVADPGHL